MRILCLYNNDCALRLFHWLESIGHECVYLKEKIDVGWLKKQNIELAVSYTYSKIIKREVIELLNGNIVNIHNSYLPFNRGSDPNMWSLVDDTPRGVTLHFIDEKLDKGLVIDQILLPQVDCSVATLKSTYNELDNAAFELFKVSFANYSHWNDMEKMVVGLGSYHSDKDGDRLRKCIESYDMTVSDFLERVRLADDKQNSINQS